MNVSRFKTVADWLTQVIKNGKEPKQLIHTVCRRNPEKVNVDDLSGASISFFMIVRYNVANSQKKGNSATLKLPTFTFFWIAATYGRYNQFFIICSARDSITIF